MKRRQGFTIVELLVAMALILFMMAILSQAFVASTTAFRSLKAAGDMANKLRATTTLLQRDLSADHFEANKRLSDPNFWLNGPPQQGFFQIYQGTASAATGPNDFLEGTDPSIIGSYRSIDHSLAFTIKLRGNDMSDFLSASAAGGGSTPLNTATPPLTLSNLTSFGPIEARYQGTSGGSYNYQWGEVEWFLQPSINPSTLQRDTTVADPETLSPAMPLYTLYRRQRLLVPDNNLVQPPQLATSIGGFLDMSCWANGASLYFNSPMDVTVPARRFGLGLGLPRYAPIPQGLGYLSGSDIQLTDVVSFDVRLLPLYPVGTVSPVPDPFVTLFQPPFTTFANGNTSFGTAAVFDTWSSLNDSLASYSQWNVSGSLTSIPLWSTLALTYQYPVGSLQTITLTNSGPIIQAIQISIRIWDAKTNQTRQVTIVQAM